jgi:hypothetical protein
MNIFRALSAFATPRRLLIVASAAVAVFVFASGGRADASAMLTALPADVVIPAGQSSGTTMLTWNTFSAQGAQIYVSVDGAPEVPQIVNASAVGAQSVTVNATHTYLFKLYVGQKGVQGPAATAQVKAHHLLKADLTVKYDGFINGKLRITVKNKGADDTGSYRIAVLAGADSYSIFAGPLAAGASKQFALSDDVMGCNRPIAILVDVDHIVDESVENNNGTGFNTPCIIDDGPVKIPEDD